jgi:nitrite reductase/ring-hydroxylating ferredoxin subunit
MAKDGHQKVANKKDLQEGGLLKVEPQGKPIVLSMVDGKVYAMDAVCSHEGGPLEEGTLERYNLTCPWHYAIFDVRNTKVSDQTVWATDLNSYQVEIDEKSGDIYVNLKVSGEGKDRPSTQPSAKEEVSRSTQQLQEQRRKRDESKPSQFNLRLLEKQKVEGTDVMSFKFAKQEEEEQQEQQQQEQGQNGKRQLEHSAGQFAFFDIGRVYNDPEGPIRHFTIASSPTEDFIMISTRIRDTPFNL